MIHYGAKTHYTQVDVVIRFAEINSGMGGSAVHRDSLLQSDGLMRLQSAALALQCQRHIVLQCSTSAGRQGVSFTLRVVRVALNYTTHTATPKR